MENISVLSRIVWTHVTSMVWTSMETCSSRRFNSRRLGKNNVPFDPVWSMICIVPVACSCCCLFIRWESAQDKVKGSNLDFTFYIWNTYLEVYHYFCSNLVPLATAEWMLQLIDMSTFYGETGISSDQWSVVPKVCRFTVCIGFKRRE